MGLEDGWDGRRQPLGTVAKGQEQKVTAILAEPTTPWEDNQDLQAGGAACPPSSQRCASSQPGTSAGSSRDQGCPRTSPPSTAVLSTPHLALERWSFVGHFMTPLVPGKPGQAWSARHCACVPSAVSASYSD